MSKLKYNKQKSKRGSLTTKQQIQEIRSDLNKLVEIMIRICNVIEIESNVMTLHKDAYEITKEKLKKWNN